MHMNLKGRVNVTTPGTPVPLTTDPTATAAKIFFQVIPGLTGKTYIGGPAMNKSTLAIWRQKLHQFRLADQCGLVQHANRHAN